MTRLAVAALIVGATVAAPGCAGGNDSPSEPEILLDLTDSEPGEIVGLVANDEDRTIEWVDRLDGTIRALPIDGDASSDDIVEIASIPVATDGEQRGLLGQIVVDGRRFASWTEPDTLDLVVGELDDGAPSRIIWNAGESGTGAIGGVLDEIDGRILIGVGRNTGFDRESGVGGAMISLDPDGEPGQTPDVISVGYTNPWAFNALDDGEIWVSDNAAGPDPDDESVDDLERTGRADLVADRALMTRSTSAPRAPTSMVELPDGRIGICGFLDNELRAYEVVTDRDDETTDVLPTLDRAGTIMPCLTGAAVFDDGTIVTAALGDAGVALYILPPV